MCRLKSDRLLSLFPHGEHNTFLCTVMHIFSETKNTESISVAHAAGQAAVTPASSARMQVVVMATLLPNQLLANMPRRQHKVTLICGPLPLRLQPGPALAVLLLWRLVQLMGELVVPPSIYSTFQINL